METSPGTSTVRLYSKVGILSADIGTVTYCIELLMSFILPMDLNGPCMSRGSVISWIWKEEPSGGGVDGSRRLGGREDGDGEILR